jgi:nucleotide-binding universal stress UspA family protein
MQYNKILLATDGSEGSIKAAKKLVELETVNPSGASIEIFHTENYHFGAEFAVLPVEILYTNTFVPTPKYQEEREKLRKFGEKVLEETKNVFDKAGIDVKTTLVENKSPEEYVKERIKKDQIDLVVIGAKGHHWKIRQALMGSTCTNIMNDADCDVLIVK